MQLSNSQTLNNDQHAISPDTITTSAPLAMQMMRKKNNWKDSPIKMAWGAHNTF